MPAVMAAPVAINDALFAKNVFARRSQGSDFESEFTLEKED